jgi:Protein of unknown function (DUF2911)
MTHLLSGYRVVRCVALLGATVIMLLAPAAGGAQESEQATRGGLRAQPSGRGRTTVTLIRRPGDPTPARIIIDYGQPHARGRGIVGNVVPFDAPWRTGANEATSFVTDVDLMMGGVVVPKGSYTLYTLPSRSGWKLIINKNTGQWGTEYRPEQDLARVELRVRQLREPVDAFSIWLVPDVTRDAAGAITGGLPSGVLRLAWGDVELSTDWRVR